MKQKAIVSLLWGNQFEVLRQFLLTHEPMVVLAWQRTLTPEMQAIIMGTGSIFIGLDTPLSDPPVDSLDQESAKFEGAFKEFLKGRHKIAGFSNKGASQPLSDVIAERLKADLPATLNTLECLKRAAEKYDIALLVTSEEFTVTCKVAVAWAKSRGIPSLHLSHAIALADPYTVHNQLLTDKLAVFGRRGMEGYLDLGIPEERMVITGNPAWDCYVELRNNKSACRQQLNQKYQLKPELPLVVFGTTWAANLSAYGNENFYVESVATFIRACEAVKKSGVEFNALVKDRPANQEFGLQCCTEILKKLNAVGSNYFYINGDTEACAVAADVLIAVDSNYSVEGMLAQTAVINLLNPAGLLLGPSFEAETGMIEVEPHELGAALRVLLTDAAVRANLIQMAQQRIAHYNHGFGDGQAAARVAQIMSNMAPRLPHRVERFVWQEYLDVESHDLTQDYHTVGRSDLVGMYTNHPAVALDIGCATGSNGALIKQRFPECQVWGIEMNRAAAAVAQQKLDHVLLGKFEDFDLEHEGMAKGSLDAVLLADVLEHVYNPWDVMVKLRSYLSGTGQMLLSIPNVRNLLLMDDLSKGNWSYAAAGLLDITHIRFFTHKEILKFCRETGYRVVLTRHAIDNRLDAFWNKTKATLPSNIETESMILKNVNYDSLLELCTVQFYLLLEKDPLQR